ncbi:O-methylsterigmatocystin oxidoreductase [Rhizoctonia solani]|uniref:O-methylsterigmatocystin oxidoreductase n=1 Tax=Rhizoctonia solani TaxID=456999 RepID=A0A0K6FU31_9AGAM|nr:O-methylsterigmatocystin oxidoreductase [Rhizoctonia solani]
MIASPNLMNMKDFVAFMDTNELWKKQRRTMNARLNKQAVTAFRSLQDLEARRLLVRLLKAHTESVSSDFLNEEFYRTTSAVFLESVYGYELKSPQDRFFVDTMIMNANLSKAALPTSFLVNLLPWLEYLPEWIPGAGWKKTAYEWRKQKDRAMGEVFQWAKQRILNGVDESSIVALTFKEARGMGWNEAAVDAFCKNVATGLLAAGTESSTLAMLWFVLAMVLHPEVQAKAQKEIDTVVGPNRLPTVEDRVKLPYIDRVLTEIMRWHPAVPLGVPHICTKEGEYRGYRIPKGAMIFGHIGATVLDERVYKDAHKFEPDRFLDSSVPLPLVFGWGQRICPGQHFFREIFYLEAVMILATMNIETCKGESGEEIVPTEATTENGAIARPVPFKVKLTPRSEHHAELMRTAA